MNVTQTNSDTETELNRKQGSDPDAGSSIIHESTELTLTIPSSMGPIPNRKRKSMSETFEITPPARTSSLISLPRGPKIERELSNGKLNLTTNSNIGIDLWNKRRAIWTGGNITHSVAHLSLNSNNNALDRIKPDNYISIYESLVYERKKLVKPLNLSFVVKVLKAGWIRDGFWPVEYPPQLELTPSDKDIQPPDIPHQLRPAN